MLSAVAPFQNKLNVVCKGIANRAPLKGRLLALSANIRICLKRLTAANSPAYYRFIFITIVRSFIVQATTLGFVFEGR
jgi:hypothetical protein